MRKILTVVLTFLFILPVNFTIASATNNDTTTDEKLGKPDFEIELSFTSTVLSPYDEFQIGITIQNIVPDDGLALLHILLYYDASKVEPVIKNDGQVNAEMDNFLIKAPELEEWRSGALCRLYEEEGYYDITFLTAKNSGYAKDDYSLIIAIPFKVKNSATGFVRFWVPDDDTTYGMDAAMNQVFGNGKEDITLISGDTPIVGAVSISGIALPGQTLTANANGIKPAGADLVYLWSVDGVIISGNYGNTYTVTEADVGKNICVIAYGTGKYGGGMMSSGIPIAAQINSAPPAPSLYRKGAGEIILWPYDGCEYKIEGGEWQDSNVFTGLTAGDTYKFYARYKTPSGSETAPTSEPFTIKLTNSVVGIIDDASSPNFGYLCGLPAQLTYEAFKEIMGSGASVIDADLYDLEPNRLIGTGMVFFNGSAVPIVIKGDLNGDGKINPIDCLRLKKAIIRTITLEGAYLRAACVSDGIAPYSMDYLRLKKYLLGNYEMY